MRHHRSVAYSVELVLHTGVATVIGDSVDQLHHTRSVAYSAELVLLNKHQISGGRADLHLMLPHRPAGCILGAGVAGIVFLYIDRCQDS